jgi:hypothetical protein
MNFVVSAFVSLLLVSNAVPAERDVLLERLSRAVPEKGFVGFVGAGSIRRELLVEQNPNRVADIDAAVKRHDTCIEPYVGETVIRQLILRELETTLTDAQLAEVVGMLEGPDFAKLLQLMGGPLGAEVDKKTLDAAKRVAGQRGFSIFGAVVNDAIGNHLLTSSVQAGMKSCDDALAQDLAVQGLKSGS